MLQEINNFMNSLPAELKQAGLKPKEGLHVLLKIFGIPVHARDFPLRRNKA